MTACSAPSVEPSPTPTLPPTAGPELTPLSAEASLSITAPEDNGALKLDQDWNASISFDVSGFTLTESGACGSTENCGKVLAFLDEGRFPDPVGESISSPMEINLAHLGDSASGPHLLTLRLVYHDGTATSISDSVTTRVQTPELPQQPVPGIFITAPAPNALTKLGADPDLSLDVYFQTSNITLTQQGSCTSTVGNCGHVRARIDGSQGDLSVEQPYNAMSEVSPITTHFGVLAQNGLLPFGIHTLSLGLYHDDGTPFLNASNEPVSSEISLRTIASTDPYVAFLPDINQSTQIFADDGWMRVFLPFESSGFLTSGLCAPEEVEPCGYINLYIDGVQGAAPDTELYHQNASLYDPLVPAPFIFYWVGYNGYEPEGRHVVTLQLMNADGSPVILYGSEDGSLEGISITSSTTITTQYAEDTTNPIIAIQSPKQGDIVTVSDGKIIVDVTVRNFALQDACGGEAQCGSICLQWNSRGDYDHACDASGIETALSLSTDVLDSPYAEEGHWISATLQNSEGVVAVDGVPVVDNVLLILQAP